MLGLYKYTDSEIKQLLNSIIILIDSREKDNKHILEYLFKKNVKYKTQALSFGDYSYMLPENKKLGIERDIYFNHNIIIERKASLEELSNNLAQNRERFENEFLRANKSKKYLVIESGSFSDLVNHNYNTMLGVKAFIASLMTFNQRYDLDINFIDKQYSGQYIYGLFYYHLREFLIK